MHSTASDGMVPPSEVVDHAARAGLAAIALTDHDTMDGVAAAAAAGARRGITIVAGCEFSVRAWWGELHLLGYFLPPGDPDLAALFDRQRDGRRERARSMVARLLEMGVPVSMEAVDREAGGAPIGRPHVARALVGAGRVESVYEAFDRFLADGGPAYVPKSLPDLEAVTAMVRRLGGVTSAAHLKDRATQRTLRRLRDLGVDGIEVLHPAHDDATVSRLTALVPDLDLLPTGGSDWHGNGPSPRYRRDLGTVRVSQAWLDDLAALHRERRPASARNA